MMRRNDKILVNAWVDEETYKRLEDARWNARTSRAEWIREAIREKLEREAEASA